MSYPSKEETKKLINFSYYGMRFWSFIGILIVFMVSHSYVMGLISYFVVMLTGICLIMMYLMKLNVRKDLINPFVFYDRYNFEEYYKNGYSNNITFVIPLILEALIMTSFAHLVISF